LTANFSLVPPMGVIDRTPGLLISATVS